MNFPYLELPDGSGWPRPLLDVTVGDVEEMRVRCLVDSGALNTLLPGWVATMAGIDLADTPEMPLGVGGSGIIARMATTVLTVGEQSWEAEVGFCDPWPRSWGLLGQLSFFRYFEVTMRAADSELELQPIAR